jgi:hypothetical protein
MSFLKLTFLKIKDDILKNFFGKFQNKKENFS